MKVKEVADLVGCSVRTLHHYDDIGLLTPQESTDAGYRLYTDEDLAILQQILFFKELGFSLKQIKEIIYNSSFNRQEALQMQRTMLLAKKNKIENMIRTIERTIKHEKGELQMSNTEKFEGFNFSNNPYEQEAREKWGNKAVDEANERTKSMSSYEQDKFNDIYRKLALIRHLPPNSLEAQGRIAEWYHFLNTIGTYSLEAFKGLGQLYINDERFLKSIDQFGEGLASFMCDAMSIYADSNK